MVELGSVIKVKPGVTRGPLCLSVVQYNPGSLSPGIDGISRLTSILRNVLVTTKAPAQLPTAAMENAMPLALLGITSDITTHPTAPTPNAKKTEREHGK